MSGDAATRKSSMTERMPRQVPESGVCPVTTNSTSSAIVAYGFTGSPFSAALRSAKNCRTTARLAAVASAAPISGIRHVPALVERDLDEARIRIKNHFIDEAIVHTEHAAADA